LRYFLLQSIPVFQVDVIQDHVELGDLMLGVPVWDVSSPVNPFDKVAGSNCVLLFSTIKEEQVGRSLKTLMIG
jgi:hypothetical protein